MMQKQWYIEINGQKLGPFSVYDLKRDSRVTPDTLVWKEGFDRWKRIREVPELRVLFTDEEESSTDKDLKSLSSTIFSNEEMALDNREEPPYFFWILFAVIVITYVLSQLYWT